MTTGSTGTVSDPVSVSVVLPVFNEEALLRPHLEQICEYLTGLNGQYQWEVLIVNDGSTDRTGGIAEKFASARDNVRVLHHPQNFGLGQALRFGFANTRGDYVVTLDIDLSYDVRHVGELLERIQASPAKIILASPYMTGGSIRNVPFIRRTLSICANKFLSSFVRGHFSTLTSLIRIYDGPFIRSLDLRAMGMDIMPETLYKGMVLRAGIDEMPGRLDWGPQLKYGHARQSSMRLLRHVFSTIMSGFVFRPFLFFVMPGIAVSIFAIYANFWMAVHFFEAVRDLEPPFSNYRWSEAFKAAFQEHPHTFITAFLSAMLAIQLVGLGVIALQSKRYFEELFHLGAGSLRTLRKPIE